MANYDPKLEKIVKEKEAKIGNGLKVKAKVYSYNGSPPKFKLLFISERRDGSEFFTTKFPALLTQKEVQTITKLMTEVSGGLK
jgi:hypothetical protein